MTNVTTFLTTNATLLSTMVLVIVSLFSAIVAKNKQLVYTRLYALISDAEQLKGAKGLEKFNYVLDKAYNSLPFWIKFFISEDNIKMAIEYSLTKLKKFAAIQMDTKIAPTKVI